MANNGENENQKIYVGKDKLSYLLTLLKIKNDEKVSKIDGKGLSTNDLTNELKAKYDTAATKVNELTETGGEPNKIETVKVNGKALQIDANKAVDVSVPTKISDLTNDNNFVSDASYVHTDNNYTLEEKNKLAGLENYNDTEIKQQIAQAGKIDTIKVNGTAKEVTDKTVELEIPTDASINSLIEAKGYQTANDVEAKITGKGYQTESQVNTIVQSVVGAAPEALDTLKELADALGNDENFAGTMTTELSKKVNSTDLVEITNAEIDEMMADW